MKIEWELEPAMTGENKKTWQLIIIRHHPGALKPARSTFGYFKSIKAAKAMVAHMKHKVIKL